MSDEEFRHPPYVISWASKIDVLHEDGTHIYWSTHCRHGGEDPDDPYHRACTATELAPGVPRKPAQCKTCAAPCVCGCHP